jgi:hypothetical protein
MCVFVCDFPVGFLPSAAFLFPTADVIKNTQSYYEIYSVSCQYLR